MTKSKPSNPARPTSSATTTSSSETPMAAKDHYQREKARRARHAQPDSEAMASAKREYQALLETNAVKGRGGRPKKQAAKPTDDEIVEEDGADTE